MNQKTTKRLRRLARAEIDPKTRKVRPLTKNRFRNIKKTWKSIPCNLRHTFLTEYSKFVGVPFLAPNAQAKQHVAQFKKTVTLNFS